MGVKKLRVSEEELAEKVLVDLFEWAEAEGVPRDDVATTVLLVAQQGLDDEAKDKLACALLERAEKLVGFARALKYLEALRSD